MVRLTLFLFTLKLLTVVNPNPVNANYTKANLPDGDHTDYYPNGNVSAIYKTINGNLDGVYRIFDRNGNKQEVLYFDNGKFNTVNNDTNKMYNEDGSLRGEELYSHDTLLFVCDFFYYKNGILAAKHLTTFDKDSLSICPFIKSNRKRVGYVNFDMELTILQMRSHGKYINYYESGNLKDESDLINDKSEGDCRGYYEDGKILCIGSYHNDLRDGIFTYYDEDGTVTNTETWSKGKLIKK